MLGLVLLVVGSIAGGFSGRAHVIDGDTLRVGSERVRLFGIDAPEISQRCGMSGTASACGKTAAAWLRSRSEGAMLECDRVSSDRYGRTVAVCRRDGRDLGAELVAAGWAIAYRRYSLRYASAEQVARAGRKGIWATKFEDPAAYRARRRAPLVLQTPPNPRCAIKGNIGAGGRIYHLPGTRAYAKVRIDQQRGERWFCSISQAIGAGWRGPRRS